MSTLHINTAADEQPVPAGHLHPNACLPLTGVVHLAWLDWDNHIGLHDSQRRERYSGIRHSIFDFKPPCVWQVTEYRYDAIGTRWERRFHAVTDDFGWLIEVPTC